MQSFGRMVALNQFVISASGETVLQYKIYLDVCCLNRPFDDWRQDRVRFEGEAVLSILERIRVQNWQLISSEAIEAELERLPNPDKLANILNLLAFASDYCVR